MLIRVLSAMEAANPPSHDDLAGVWKIPVSASVESLGFLDLYLGEDGIVLIDRVRGDDGKTSGYWSLDGANFSIKPAEGVEPLDYFGFRWFGEIENLRIIVFEYEGELYKACNFFDEQPLRGGYKSNNLPPLEYFGY